jgi:putative PIN family toxin of toxin-antitoxin system
VRVVLDTNVVVSALIWGGPPFSLLQAAVDRDIKLFTTPTLIAELRAVLAREHLASRLESQRSLVERAVQLYYALAIELSPISVPRVVPADIADDHVIAAAIAAQAELLVSGDRQLLTLRIHQSVRIVTPAEAVRLLATV